MPCRTSLPVSFFETSTFESSQETRREGLVKVPNLSLESFLSRLPWHNAQGCPRYCLSWGKKWKERKIELPPVLDWIYFFQEGKKNLKDNTVTPPTPPPTPTPHHSTHAFFLLSLCLVQFNSMSHLFHAVLSTVPSKSPALLDAIFLPAS